MLWNIVGMRIVLSFQTCLYILFKNNYWSISQFKSPAMNFCEPVYVDPFSSYVLPPFPSPSSQYPQFPWEVLPLFSKTRWNMTSYQRPPWISLDWINCSFIYIPKGASSYICKSTYHISLELFAYLCPFWTFSLDGGNHIFLI